MTIDVLTNPLICPADYPDQGDGQNGDHNDPFRIPQHFECFAHYYCSSHQAKVLLSSFDYNEGTYHGAFGCR